MLINFKKVLIVILTVVAGSLFLSNQASPDSLLFGVKRLQEKVFMNISQTPEKKVDYYMSLLDKRLEEIDYLVKNKQSNYLWSASLRYSTSAGEISKLIVDNNLTSYASKAITKFKSHQIVLKNLDETFPNHYNVEEWKYLQDDSNYIDLYINQLSQIQ